MRTALFFILGLIPGLFFSQTAKDSLFQKWENEAVADTQRIAALEQFIKDYCLPYNPDSTIVYAKKGYQFSAARNFRVHEINAFMLMAIGYYNKGDVGKALDYYRIGLNSVLKIKDNYLISRAYRNMGILYFDKGYFKKSLAYFKLSLKYADPKSAFYSLSLSHIAYSYEKVKDYPSAVRYYKEAVANAEKNNDKNRLALYYASLGAALIETDLTEAQHILDIGFKHIKNENHLINYDIIYSNLYLHLKKYDLAKQYGEQAVAKSIKTGDRKNICLAYFQCAKLYYELRQYSKAQEYGEKAFDYGKSGNMSIDLKNITSLLLKIYETEAGFKKPFEVFRFQSTISDSINRDVLLQYELNKAFDKKLLKDSLNSVQSSKIQRLKYNQKLHSQRLFGWAGLVAAFLLLMICVFIYKNYQHKKKINTIISKQNKSLEIQKELSQKHVVALLAVIESARDFIAFSNDEVSFSYINNAGKKWLHIDHLPTDQKHKFIDVFDKETVHFINTVAIAECREKDFFSGEITIRLMDKTELPVLLNIVCHTDPRTGISQYSMIARDISDLKKYQEKIVQQNKQLQKVNYELDRFVYSTSHDIRAPLTSVIGIVNILDGEFLAGDKDFQMYLEMIRFSINRTDDIIKSILEYSKNSRALLEIETIDAAATIDAAVKSFSGILKKEQIRVNVAVSGEIPFKNDRMRFEILLNNLIENAIKFQRRDEKHKRVSISFETETGKSILVVSDNGSGIEPKFHQKVFEMFFRASNASSGSGLGLYVVSEIVEIIGGELFLESDLGKGTRITIIFPNLGSKHAGDERDNMN